MSSHQVQQMLAVLVSLDGWMLFVMCLLGRKTFKSLLIELVVPLVIVFLSADVVTEGCSDEEV